MRLKDKVALISGSGSGIGEATAKRLAAEGAAVVVVDLNEEGATRVAGEIRSAGGTAEALVANVGNPPEVEHMIKFATDKFGQLDILHNNAIRLYTGRVGEMTLEHFRKAVEIGLTAYWYATRCALGVMVPRRKGAIINTGSVSGLAGDYGLGAYNAIKAGVINLTRATAIESARKGLRCHAVCPGIILTPPILKSRRALPEMAQRSEQAVPMGRCGEPIEIANVVLFLASDEASYVTGTCIVADGGLMAHTGMPSITGGGADW
ncbi:MAG: SDR family NAD(P)-dependent oxidoreductase [Candidatus Binatus sp.]|uniref:SDR family NAD(P)-dependent oxidoreductase n=1 Tax=Candidatus Binatus sp. TaxID=2811406 RepID=UPI002727D9A4|nr:SDR family NAD(P)-dependent oxidoreductase [Candidatus Binatus sp.]MDO8434238.1 SDR family NAD(P)-dependent oxidoreductase [Candidatus Binatus sp.]